jgi:branched-subunit amino acid aminotransferase/4-amino-4-deoxychorismate lyase
MNVPDCYLNGQWVDRTELALGVDDLGVLQGVAVSERLRTFAGRVFRQDDHLRRLRRSLEIVRIPDGDVCRQVEALLPEVVRRSGVALPPGDDLTIVLFVTPGSPASGAQLAGSQPTVCIYARPLPFSDWVERYAEGERLITSSVRQVPPECWPVALKCRSRMHYYLADLEAADRDPAARALLVDHEGFVSEASTANILMVQGGTLVSPRLEKILPGVSLQAVRELADELGIPFEFRDVAPGELREAHEVLLASTSPCLLPVTGCDGQPIGGGEPGAVFDQLIRAWGAQTGVDIIQQARQFAKR